MKTIIGLENLRKAAEPNNSIGAYVAGRGTVESFELAAYIQKWSDLLEIGYFEISILPLFSGATIEERIDDTIKKHYPDAFKKISVMAKILGGRDE